MIFNYAYKPCKDLAFLDPKAQKEIIENEARRGLMNAIYENFIKDLEVEKHTDTMGEVYYLVRCACDIKPIRISNTAYNEG